jgi:predicted nucleotidyltransferase
MFGLKNEQIDRICRCFEQFPDINKVIIFGSRAKGNYKPGSDVDLILVGDQVTDVTLFELETLLDDLLLPFIFDIKTQKRIENTPLSQYVSNESTVFWQK